MGVGLLLLLAVAGAARPSCPGERLSWAGASVERRTRRAGLVFHGLAVEDYPAVDPANPPLQGHRYSAQFWLISVYKGADRLAPLIGYQQPVNGVYDIRDRRVNVTGFYRPNGTGTPKCWLPVTSQKYYVVFAEISSGLEARDDATMGAIADWTEKNEQRVWRAIGWDEWSDWSVCSKSCDGGTQQRWRYCLQQAGCQGYNKQTRICNTFSCTGAVAPLSLEGKRQWERVPGRETAWRLRTSSYFWLPAAQLPFPANYFRNHFALILSLRLDPKKVAGGTLFSLKSRRREECYFAVELAGSDAIKMVHSGPNGTQSVLMPAPLADGKWHQLAIGIQDDSSVRSYFDCRWVSTDILKKNSLDIPDDADLVIGYLFSGELEQMVIVGDPGGVAQQCSTNLTPVLDPLLEAARPHKKKPKLGTRTGRWEEKRSSTTTELPLLDITDDEDIPFEGSGQQPPEEEEYEEDRCLCQNGGTCRQSGTCHCPRGYEGPHCQKPLCKPRCKNGGTCIAPATCACPPLFTGNNCQTMICEPPCENGGTCSAHNICRCPPNTNGPRCQNFSCGGCENGGHCVGPGLCECPHNATGPLCQTPLCEPPCQNGATCSQGNTCLCHPYTSGTRCQNKKCEYRPVQEPYTRGFRKLVKKHYETKCEPFSWKTCIRTVPEYQTVYKTFYRTVYKCLDQP